MGERKPAGLAEQTADQEGWAAAELASVQISIDQVIQVRHMHGRRIGPVVVAAASTAAGLLRPRPPRR